MDNKKKRKLLILKETGIILMIIILAVVGGYFAFKDYIPYNLAVPEAAQYAQLVKSNYKVVGDVQDAQNPTETISTSPTELEIYQTEIRYVPGTVNPFEGGTGDNDLPSEVVSSPSSSESYINDYTFEDISGD